MTYRCGGYEDDEGDELALSSIKRSSDVYNSDTNDDVTGDDDIDDDDDDVDDDDDE